MKMDHGDWLRREEMVAELPEGTWDLGLGDEAQELLAQRGLELRDLARLRSPRELEDGGADKLRLRVGNEELPLYVRRRKRHVDYGTRKDFRELGWERVCDLLDAAEEVTRLQGVMELLGLDAMYLLALEEEEDA